MTWAEPTWFWVLPLLAVLAALATWFTRRGRAALAAQFGPALLERVLPRAVRLRRSVRTVAWFVGLVACVIALAEPRFGKRLREVEAEGVDLVLVVDLSRSMDAQDVDPSRLERARREILDLVDLMQSDRVGMVIFAGGAWPRLPLTLDRGVLRQVVRELDTRTFQAQGSALDEALRQAAKLLVGQQGEAGQAIIVLSDGEIHDPPSAFRAADDLATQGIPVFGLVIGSAPAPIPNEEGGPLRDPTSGETVTTTPSTETLGEIARRTGGAVARSVPGNDDVRSLYEGEIRPALRAAVMRQGTRETWQSAFQTPLAVGTILLLLSAWLGDGRRRTALLGVLLAAGLASPVAQAATVRDGDLAYRAEDYEEAARIFTELALTHPDDPELLERLAAARYRAGDAVGAARAFGRQADLTGDADARFHEGNAWWQAGQLDRALERYDRVLAEAPNHPGASSNRQLLQEELSRRMAQAPPPPPKSDQGEADPNSKPGDPGQGEQSGESESAPEPSPGEKTDPESGSSSEGEPGEKGEPAEGEPQSGQQGEQPGGEPTPAPGDAGTRNEDGNSERAEGQATEGEGGQEGEPGEVPASGNGTPTEDMGAEQAGRVLDGVEEGRPRVYIPGERSAKPW